MWQSKWLSVAIFASGVLLGWIFGIGYLAGLKESGNVELDLSLAEGRLYRVLDVKDGDTVVLENGIAVRYCGINTPERGRFIPVPAPLSAEATAFNKSLVAGKQVYLEFADEPLDAYGRLIARIFLPTASGRQSVEALLVQEGLAEVMGLGISGAEYRYLRELEEEAKREKRGIWGIEHPLDLGNPDGFKFCCSAKSDVYHPVDSPVAKKISARHFIGFRTEQDALRTGRRPAGQK